VTIFAAIVSYFWSRGTGVTLTNSVVPLLAVVVGLILVFRNGTSYDRYYEGRKTFGSLTSSIRNLTRLIWINVALPPPQSEIPENLKGKTQPTTALTAAQLRRKKVDAVKLVLSFAFAVKHYLRGEDGLDWNDYLDVMPSSFLRSGIDDNMALSSSTRSSSYGALMGSSITMTSKPRTGSPERDSRASTPDATKRIRVKRSNPTLSTRTPLLGVQGGGEGGHRGIDVHAEVTMPLPLIIAHEISHQLFQFKRDGFLETVGPAGANAMHTLVQGMVDQLTNMERIVNTPIPKSYGIHLKQVVTLYLFALPFTLIKELGWATIPIVTVVAFTFMGIEGIADEIEMPFGNDSADLPLDRYVYDLKEEIDYLFQRLPEGGQGMVGFDDGEGDD